MFIIEQRYGNDGYSFWFKLLEALGSTPGHCLDLNCEMKWEFLQAKTRLSASTCEEILNLLAKLSAIDPSLWAKKMVWSQNFVDGISDVYRNRRVEIPQRPELSVVETISFHEVSTVENPQSKVKETKVKKIKYSDDFLSFWKEYPRKVGRDKAWKAWEGRNGDRPPTNEIIEVVVKQRAVWSDPKYIPHPATWINAGRWADEIEVKEKSRWFDNEPKKETWKVCSTCKREVAIRDIDGQYCIHCLPRVPVDKVKEMISKIGG
jgi:hypothetical protein